MRQKEEADDLSTIDADEGTLFVLAGFYNESNVTTSTYNGVVSTVGGAYASAVASAYPLSSFNTSGLYSPDPGFAPFYALASIYTDSTFKCPARRSLNITTAAKIPAYTYRNEHTPQCSWESAFPEQILAPLGAAHSSELQFVFDQTTNLPGPNGTCSQTSQERDISRVLISAWTSMAANGNPGNVGNQQWPTFNLQQPKGLVITNSTAIGAIDYSNCDAIWDPLAAIALANTTSNGTSTGTSPTGSTTASTTSAASANSGTRSLGPNTVGILLLITIISGAALCM